MASILENARTLSYEDHAATLVKAAIEHSPVSGDDKLFVYVDDIVALIKMGAQILTFHKDMGGRYPLLVRYQNQKFLTILLEPQH